MNELINQGTYAIGVDRGECELFLSYMVTYYDAINSFCLQSLGVLINLVEHCPGNAKILTNTKTNYSYDAQTDGNSQFSNSGQVCSLESLTQVS